MTETRALTPVQWLEQDYDGRHHFNGWYNKSGTSVVNANAVTYKRDLYQIVEDTHCINDCYCFSTPEFIQGLPWSEADDALWMETGSPGQSAAFAAYLRKMHPYVREGAPNDLDFWREDGSYISGNTEVYDPVRNAVRYAD